MESVLLLFTLVMIVAICMVPAAKATQPNPASDRIRKEILMARKAKRSDFKSAHDWMIRKDEFEQAIIDNPDSYSVFQQRGPGNKHAVHDIQEFEEAVKYANAALAEWPTRGVIIYAVRDEGMIRTPVTTLSPPRVVRG